MVQRPIEAKYRAQTEDLVKALEHTERWSLQRLSLGRFIIIIGNLMYAVGAFIADWNETHVKNPLWPPHARFHNGQTMTLGVCLAAGSIYFAFRPTIYVKQIQQDMFSAALVGSFYCFAGMTAILYPGTDWNDPGHDAGGPQKYLFTGIVLAMWLGYKLEMQNIHSKYFGEKEWRN